MKTLIAKSLTLALFLLLGVRAPAQTFTNYWWTNTLGGNWSAAGNWTNILGANVKPATGVGGINNVLTFVGVGPYAAMNDNAGAFALNKLVLLGANITLGGNQLVLTNASTAWAYITNNANSGSSVINNAIRLGTNLVFAGSGSAGLTLNSPITAISGAVTNALIKSGSYPVTLAGTNVLGPITNSAGTLTFAASSTNYIAKGPILINGGTAGATLNVNGPTALVLASGIGNLQVGNNNGDRSVAVINTNFSPYALQVGAAGTSAGAVYHTAGTVSIATTAGTGVTPIGSAAGSYGYYRITGGALASREIDIATGAGANGCMDILGGTVTSTGPTGFFTIGRGQNGTSRQYATVNIWGGEVNTVSITNNVMMGYNLTNRGVQNLNIGNGGSLTINPAKALNMMQATSSYHTNTVTLAAGGTLTTPQVLNGGTGTPNTGTNQAILNLVGGTLRANTNSTDFIKNLDATYLYSAGAVIDSQAFTVTNNATLLAAAGDGISGIAVNSQGTGYIAAPIVNIVDPTGVGATALAQIDTTSQKLTNILVTCPGSGYTSPTVTLIGGGATAVATLGTIATAPNANTGWVTKQGTGTLVMSYGSSYIPNTYGGNTTNSAGRLLMGYDNALGSGTYMANGGTLGVNGGSWTLANPIALLAPGNNFEANGGTLTLSGVISGAGGLSKVGTNNLILTGNNDFTGGVTNSSTNAIVITTSTALGLGSKTVQLIPTANNNPQPNLTLDGSSGDLTLGANYSFVVSASGGAIINYYGNNTVNGNFAITGGGGYTLFRSDNGTLNMNGSVTNIYTGLRQLLLGGASLGDGSGVAGYLNGPVLLGAQVTELAKQDASTWVVTSTNTYNGGTYVNGGTLVLGPTGSMTNSTLISISSNAVFDVSAVGGFALTPGHTLMGNGLFNLSGDLVVSSNATINPVALNANGGVIYPAGTLTVSNANVVLDGGCTLLFDLGDPSTVGGPMNDLLSIPNGNLTVTAPVVVNFGVFTSGTYQSDVWYPIINFSGSFIGDVNSFTNTQNFREGVTFSQTGQTIFVKFGTGSSLASLVWRGDGVTNAWDLLTTSNWLNGAALDTFRQGDMVTFDDSGSNNVPVSLVGANLAPSVAMFNAAKDYTLTGTAMTGYGRLAKDNSGKLTIANVNTMAGGTVINNGILQVGNGTTVTATPGPGPITNNATLIHSYGGADITLANAFSGAGTWVISNSGGGNRAVNLSGDNSSFTGTLYLTNGSQRVQGWPTNYGNSSVIYVANNGQLWPRGATDITYANPITISGLGYLGDAYPSYGALRLDNVTWAGPITLSGDASLGANANGAVTGDISGPYELIFAQGAGKIITLSGNNTTKSTRIINATVKANSYNALSTGPLTMLGGVLQLNGQSLTFSNLTSTATAANVQNGTATTGGMLTLGDDNTSTIFAGTLTDGAGTLALAKNGSGILTLSGANAFTGGTTISAGTIAAVSASALGNGPVAVNANTTLRVNSAVATTANLLKIGGSGLTLNDNCTIAMALSTNNALGSGDLLYATNMLTLASDVNTTVRFDFSFPKGPPATNVYYTIITNLVPTTAGSLPNFTTAASHYGASFTNTGYRIQVMFTGGGVTNLVWTGNGGANQWVADNTVLNWLNGASKDYFGMGDTVVFNDVGSTNPIVNLEGNVLPAAVTVDTTVNDYTFTGSGKLSGATRLTKTGTGTLTINTTNDNSGIVTISNGTVSVPSLSFGGAAGPLGAASGASANLVLAGGKLQYTGAGQAADRGATLAAASSIEVLNASANLTNSGVIVGTAGSALTKVGPGILTLSGANTYSGDTLIENGIIRLGNAAGLGSVAGTAYVTNSGTLDVSGLAVGAKPIVVAGLGYNGLGVIDNSSATAQQNAFTKTVTMVGDTTFNASGARWDIRNAGAGLVCGNAQPYNLTKIGTNMMAIANGATVDTNLADINILSGTFSVEGLATLGNPTNNMNVASNAAFRMWTGTVPLVKNAYLTNGIFEVNGGGANRYAGPVNLVRGSNAFNFSAGGTLTNSGPIMGSGLLAQVNSTSGNLYLLGTNSYSGGTYIGAGTMFGNTYSLQGNITNNATLTLLTQTDDSTLNAFITGTGTVNKNSTNILTLATANTFSGTLNLNSGMTAISVDGAVGIGTLNLNGGGLQSADANLRTVTNYFLISANGTLGAPGTGNLLFSAPQVNNGAQAKTLTISNALSTISGNLTNTGSLTKAGPGTLALDGNNNISGLVISQGTLALGASASITNATTITMASEAVLDVSASGSFTLQSNQELLAGRNSGDPSGRDLTGSLINNGGEIFITDAGIGGYLNIGGGLTLNGGTLHYDLTDPTYSVDYANDAIQMTGLLDVSGTVLLDVPPIMPDGTYYLILGFTGWGSGSPSNFVIPPGRRGTYEIVDDGAGSLILTVTGATGNTETWQGYANNVWDFSTLNWTNLAYATATNFSQGDTTLFDDTALAYANATNVDFEANVLQPTAIIVSNNVAAYTLLGTNGGGKLTGGSSLTKRGAGVLTMLATNDFYGTVRIEQGLVVMGNTYAAGASPLGNPARGSVTVTNGGSLDLNITAGGNINVFDARKLLISGAGYDGQGAVVNNGSQASINAVRNLTLAGNATVGGSNRWDLRANGTVPATLSTKSNAFSLTKVGNGQFSIVAANVDPYLADINVQAGLFGFETTSTSLGNPTNILSVQPGAVFQFWAATNQLNKSVVLNGGTLRDGSGANTIIGPVTLNSGGTNIIDTTGGNLTLLGPVGGAAGFAKINGNTLILGTNNTWSGGMTISNGTVQIGTNGLYGTPGLGDITNYLTTGTLVYNVAAPSIWNNNIYGVLGTLTVATNTGGLTLSGSTYAVGQVNVNGGSLTLNTGSMNLGTNALNVAAGVAGQTALFQVVSGNFTNTAQNSVGTAANASGIIKQTGGNYTMTGNMYFGGAIGNYGAYQISGGNASFGGDTQLGRGAAFNGGASLFSQTGGTVTSTSWFTIARDGGVGVLDISGGLHFRPATAGNRLYLVGNTAGGFAQVTLRGTGVLDNEDNQGFSFSNTGQANQGTAMVNLNPGGTLVEKTAFSWGNTAGASIGYINFNGGTLRASGSSATFLQGWTAAYVHSGGAIIDTTNNNITIAQPLLVSSGNGVTTITASGSGFVSPPVVTLTGGDGVGATALAQIDGSGNLTGVLVSNPGENYTLAPTVTFLGGGGTATGSAAIGPNDTTGGLTKLGVGTLTLTGANTYTGTTMVNAGVLAGSGSLVSPVSVNSGGALNPGTVGTPGTLIVGGASFNSGSTYALDINNTAAVGGGTNDLLVVNGNLALSVGTVVNFNVLAVPVLTGTPYTIITYTGSLSGSVANLSATGLGAGYTVTFANAPGSPSAITATINPVATPGLTPLVWQGDGATNQWSTAGYTNQFTNSLGWVAFNTADSVRFDDSSPNLTVNVAGTVVPTVALITASNNYVFTGSGKISGIGATLIKSGTGVLTVSTVNDYTGGTLISNGVIKVGIANTILGLPAGTTPLCVITNTGGMAGAALDINGINLNSVAAYTNPIVISGRSSTNAGAIYNTGAAFTGGNGIKNLALAADAAIGNNGNRFDVLGYVNGGGKHLTMLPGSGSYIALYGGPVTNLQSITAAGLGATEFGKTVTDLGGAAVTNLLRVNLYQVGGYATAYGGLFTNSTMYMSNALFSTTSANSVWGGPIVFLPGTTNTFDGVANDNFGVIGAISGAGTLRKQGSKWLQLSGDNTYTGNTLVTAGQLIFASGSTLPNSPLFSVASGAVLDVLPSGYGLALNSGQTLAGSGIVSGEVSVNNGGSVIPGAALNAAGTLILSNGQPFTVNAGSTLSFDLSANSAAGNDLISMSGGALNLNGGHIYINPLANVLETGTYTLISGGYLNSGSAANLTVSSIVPLSLLRQTLTLDSSSGNLVLNVTGGTGVGGTAGPLVWQGNNGPNWDVNSTVNWLNNAIPGADVFFTLDAVQFDDTGLGAVTLNGALFPGSLLVSNSAVAYTWSGSGTITGAVALVKAGSGTLTLNVPLSNSLPPVIREGTVAIGVPNALPNMVVQLGDRNSRYGAGLDLSSASQTIPMLNVSSTNAAVTNHITIGSGQTLTVTGDINLGPAVANGTTVLKVSGSGSFVANTPTNNLVFAKAGTGVNTGVGAILDFSGLENLSLNLNSLSIGGWDNVAAFNSTMLLATNSSLKVTNLTVGSSAEGSSMSLLLGSGANVFLVDNFNIGTGSRDYGTVRFNTASGTVAITNTAGTGRANLNIGTGNQTTGYVLTNVFDLSGHQANLYLGTIVMGNQPSRNNNPTNYFGFDQGTLDVTNVLMGLSQLAGKTSISAMSFGGGVVNVGAGGLMLASNAVGTLALSGGLVTLGGDITKGAANSGANIGTLTLSGGTLNMQGNKIGGAIPIDVLNFQAGTLENVGELNAGGSLIKSSPGTLILAGNNTYTGSTVVSNGILEVNGTIGGNTVTVRTNATLGGYGVIGGPVTVQNGGTLALGATLGALTVNNALTLQAGSTNTMKLDKSNLGSTNDHLQGITSLTYGGTLSVTVTGPALVVGDSFKLYSFGSYTGDFATLNLPILPTGLGWAWHPATGILSVVASVNPNPTNLTYSVSGNQLTLSWPPDYLGWGLQAQTNALDVGITAIWVDVPNSTTVTNITIPIDSAEPTVFYRMVLKP